jgi:hypothetical protein
MSRSNGVLIMANEAITFEEGMAEYFGTIKELHSSMPPWKCKKDSYPAYTVAAMWNHIQAEHRQPLRKIIKPKKAKKEKSAPKYYFKENVS